MHLRRSFASRIRLSAAAAALGGLGLVLTPVLAPTPAEAGPPLDVQYATYCVFGTPDNSDWYWELDGAPPFTGGALHVPSGDEHDIVSTFVDSIKSTLPWKPGAVDVGDPVNCPSSTLGNFGYPTAEFVVVTMGPYDLYVGPTSSTGTLVSSTPVKINPLIFKLPEPSAALMLASGSLLLWALQRRRSGGRATSAPPRRAPARRSAPDP